MDAQQLLQIENIDEQLMERPVAAEVVSKEYKNKYVIFSWRIFNYSQLKHHILYFRLFENIDIKCVFKLFKTRRSLYVCLRCEQISQKFPQFYIEDETKHVYFITHAREIIKGLYVGYFKNEIFFPENLKDDKLTVSFRYNDVSQPVVKQISLQEPDCIMDLSEFCNDMKYMYLAALHSDFAICVDDYTFYAHKFVLASRSKVFEDFFAENETAEEYYLIATPRIVHMTLIYMYSGEVKKMEMVSMIQMYELATELKIDKLSEKCICFISESINDDNYHILTAIANTLNSADLKTVANRYKQKRKKKKAKE